LGEQTAEVQTRWESKNETDERNMEEREKKKEKKKVMMMKRSSTRFGYSD
jgi:hypothetical protein